MRHPKGQAALKSGPDTKSSTVATVKNGARVDIVASAGRWFEVRQAGTKGFLHETQVAVREYDRGAFEERHVQIRSFDNYRDAEAFVRAWPLPLAAYLVSSGWFAITLKDTYSVHTAAAMVKMLKARGAVPDDAFVTTGTPTFGKCAAIDGIELEEQINVVVRTAGLEPARAKPSRF